MPLKQPPRGSADAVYEILHRLPERNEPQMLDQRLDPLSELILTILSQHTADRNSGPAFERLRERFPTWDEVETADPQMIADTIRGAGLANVKAARIQQVLREIRTKVGALELSLLEAMPADQGAAWLSELPGVGPKTAGCVLLFSLGKGAMPVDTHIHRVLRRYGAVPDDANATESQAFVESILNPSDMYRFHVGVIEHGRQICHAAGAGMWAVPVAPRLPVWPQFARRVARWGRDWYA